MKIPAPAIPEQQAIADFLDFQTGRIDDLIDKKRRFIERLREKRTALISHAVTKGLDPTVKLKPSGIDWLDDVPEHWDTMPLKRKSRMITGYAFSSDVFVDEGIPLLRIGDIHKDGSVNLDSCKHLPESFHKSFRRYEISKGDILMAMTGATIGKVGCYSADEPALLNQRVCSFKPLDGLNNRYLWFVLNSDFYTQHVILTAFGGAQPNISDTELLECKVPFPTIEEQQAIADFLDFETGRIDELINKVQKAIKKLQEYRSAIISATVTVNFRIFVNGLSRWS